MSGLEQRTKGLSEALFEVSANATALPAADWSGVDGYLLDEGRAAVPDFPLELLSSPWRDWVSAAARSADIPVDYVAQALLAAVAGVSSTKVMWCFTSGWLEPLHLRLAAVGAPSSGKSPALELARRLVIPLEMDQIDGLQPPPRQIVLEQQSIQGVVSAINKARHGVILWRDGPDGCFAPLRGLPDARHLESYPVTMLGSVEPASAWRALPPGGQGLVARFLYAWPHAAPFRPLGERNYPKADDVLVRLRRLLPLGALEHCVLWLDEPGKAAFDAFLSRLHAEVRQAHGLEAAWLGKGRGAVVSLAATLALMDRSATEQAEPPNTIALDAVDRAISLWWDYYRPHAQAFIRSAVPTDLDCQVRRVIGWLQTEAPATVSRKDIRRTALGQTVNARETDRVLARLVEVDVLRPLPAEKRPQGGRPALRWAVNPLLPALARAGV